MKDLKQLAQNFNAPAKQVQEHIVIDGFAKNIIDKVFDQLAIIFPAWKYNWKSDNPADPDKVLRAAKMEWTKAFNENGINSIEQIKMGFMKARRVDTDFLPSCGKFISWCKPSPESMGWPSAEQCLRDCVKYRNHKKLFGDKKAVFRPLIVELTKRIDWWLMNNVATKDEQKKADKHFNEVYMELLTSGYVEPQETEDLRLPTQETVNAGLSEQQKADKEKRRANALADIKSKLKRGKHAKHSRT